MGLKIHSLGELPPEASRGYFVYLLDYGWEAIRESARSRLQIPCVDPGPATPAAPDPTGRSGWVAWPTSGWPSSRVNLHVVKRRQRELMRDLLQLES
jgi:hypothetical protein